MKCESCRVVSRVKLCNGQPLLISDKRGYRHKETPAQRRRVGTFLHLFRIRTYQCRCQEDKRVRHAAPVQGPTPEYEQSQAQQESRRQLIKVTVQSIWFCLLVTMQRWTIHDTMVTEISRDMCNSRKNECLTEGGML